MHDVFMCTYFQVAMCTYENTCNKTDAFFTAETLNIYPALAGKSD